MQSNDEGVSRGRVRRGREEIEQLLREQQASGKTQAQFCKERGVSLKTFQGWRRRFRAEAEGFCEVQAVGEGSMERVSVRLPEGTEVFLPAGISPEGLARYVTALRKPC